MVKLDSLGNIVTLSQDTSTKKCKALCSEMNKSEKSISTETDVIKENQTEIVKMETRIVKNTTIK